MSQCISTSIDCEYTTSSEDVIGCGNNATQKHNYTLTLHPENGSCNMPNYEYDFYKSEIGDKSSQVSKVVNPPSCFTNDDIMKNRRLGDGQKYSKYSFTKSCSNCKLENNILSCNCNIGGSSGGTKTPTLNLNRCPLSLDNEYKKNIPINIINTIGTLECNNQV